MESEDFCLICANSYIDLARSKLDRLNSDIGIQDEEIALLRRNIFEIETEKPITSINIAALMNKHQILRDQREQLIDERRYVRGQLELENQRNLTMQNSKMADLEKANHRLEDTLADEKQKIIDLEEQLAYLNQTEKNLLRENEETSAQLMQRPAYDHGTCLNENIAQLNILTKRNEKYIKSLREDNERKQRILATVQQQNEELTRDLKAHKTEVQCRKKELKHGDDNLENMQNVQGRLQNRYDSFTAQLETLAGQQESLKNKYHGTLLNQKRLEDEQRIKRERREREQQQRLAHCLETCGHPHHANCSPERSI